MSAFAVALLAVGCAFAGGRFGGLLAAPGEDRLYRSSLHLTAGLVLLYAGLLALDALGIPWIPLSAIAVLAVAAAGSHLLSRLASAPVEPERLRLGWGDAVAGLCLLGVAVAAHQMWIVNPDFIFHWGIKGLKFHLARGLDFAFLVAPGSELRHADYPWLLPGLFAATGAVAGSFREPAMMLWTAVFFAALLAAARQVLARVGASPFAAQSTLAITAASSAAFGIGFLTAGGPDWILALVPLVAWPAFLRLPDRSGDLAVGMAAALAAAAKIEGVAMAAFLLGLWFLRRGAGRWRALPALVLPAVAVVGPWVALGLSHGLFSASHRGAFDLGRAGVIASALWSALRIPEWHGAPAAFLLLPGLIFLRSTRPAAALVALQLLFYLAVYFVAPFPEPRDLDYFVRSNFSRLAFHLLPTVLVGCGIACDHWLARAPRLRDAPRAQHGRGEPGHECEGGSCN